MRLLFTALACLISIYSFGQSEQDFYKKYAEYFDTHGVKDPIEGIYSYNFTRTAFLNNKESASGSESRQAAMQFVVFLNNENQLIYECSNGSVSGVLIPSASPEIYIGNFKYNNSEITFSSNILCSNNKNVLEWSYEKPRSQIDFEYARSQDLTFDQKKQLKGKVRNTFEVTSLKLYPNNSSWSSPNSNVNWHGNGSGLLISKNGYIVTNHHVIEDASEIEVEFILDDEVQSFKAQVVQSDKVNDLSIIKIVDVNFDGIGELPYNFKTRSSDVGTKVYAFGYPMALSIMGKELKVTDGIISSKSGYDGDITTYQITAPIQGGNSGGPLFDENGNFIGINSSGLSKDVADNVGYTIKSSYVASLIDVLPKAIDFPTSTKLASMPLTEQIKEITKCVVLVKVK